MKLFEQRKGITPVIAIVLLLMVTVGAVGVVYTQFNSLVGNPSEELEEQQRNQDTNIRITQMQTNASLSDNLPSTYDAANYGTIQLTISNTGSVSRNTTSFSVVATGAEAGGIGDGNCFQHNPPTHNSTILDPGETYECDTGVVYPDVTDNVQIEVLLQGSSRTWTDTCRHDRSGVETC